MLFAERAVFGKHDPVGVVTLILIAVVIAVFALCAFESYLISYLCFGCHVWKTPYKKITPPYFECF